MLFDKRRGNSWVYIDPVWQSEQIDSIAAPFIESFFKRIKTKGAAVAIEYLFSFSPDLDAASSAAINLKNNFVHINDTSGRLLNHRLLKKGFIDDDMGLYCYLAKFEKHLYRFIYTFYNNGNAVKLYKFSFDDDLDFELEKSLILNAE